MDLIYVPIPCVCGGRITSKIKDTETYEVSIYKSPMGAFSGPIYASVIYSPGMDGNYKQGDYVQVLVTFTYGSDGKYRDTHPGTANYILGLFNERSIANIKMENPLSQTDRDRVIFKNKFSQAGFSASDSGEALITSGAMHILLKAFGYGTNADECHIVAQNHHRIVGNAPPYLSREHFGMFAGNSDTDKVSKVSDDDYYINYRRFTTQTLSPECWVSTCEGAFSPWVGANNAADFIEIGKEVLFSKIINHGNLRVTVEMGEPGNSFINFRVDEVLVCEKTITNRATPATLTNQFNLKISDKGVVELYAAGKGTAKTAGFKFSITKDGDTEIHSSGKITLTHGDSDNSINSIILDPKKGIDITAKNGFRVNGIPLVNKKYLDWMLKYQASLCQTIAMGSPAPISPMALPSLIRGVNSSNTAGGFSTINVGSPASGIIKNIDIFSSV